MTTTTLIKQIYTNTSTDTRNHDNDEFFEKEFLEYEFLSKNFLFFSFSDSIFFPISI